MTFLDEIIAPDKGQIDLIDVFWSRSQSRAYLWSIGEYDLPEAVDALQAAAVRYGLVQDIGQDAVQSILADAFRPYWGAVSA